MNNLEHEPNDALQPMLRSIKGMRRAQAPEGLFGRVMEQMNRPVARVVPISRISLAAACLLVLVGLNIAVLVAKSPSTTGSAAPAIELYGTSSEYGYSY